MMDSVFWEGGGCREGWVWAVSPTELGLGVVWWRGLCRQIRQPVCWQGRVHILGCVVTHFVTILEWVQSGLTADLSSRDPGLLLSQPYWIIAPDQSQLGRDDEDWGSRWNSFVSSSSSRAKGWRPSHYPHFLLWPSPLSSARHLLSKAAVASHRASCYSFLDLSLPIYVTEDQRNDT